MARRGSGQLTQGRLLRTTVSLAFVLLGCGKSSLTIRPDAGPDGSTSIVGPEGGSTGTTDVIGGTQASGGLLAGGTGGMAATGGAGSTAPGGATGGSPRTGGTDSLTGTAGRTGGFTLGGTTATGGTTGRATTGGFSIVMTRAGNTSTGGTTATGGRGGGGASASLQTTLGSGGAGSGGTGGGGSTAAPGFQPLITAFCAAAKSCCARSSFPATPLVDCESKFLSRVDRYPLVDKGTVTVDQQTLADCASAYKGAATSCTLNPIKTACKGVFVGLQSEGQACGGTSQFGAVECSPVNRSAVCYRPQGDTDPKSAGTCMNVPHGKSGEACSSTCQKGRTCIVDMLGGTAPFPATCFEDDGLFCSKATNPPVCKPLLGTGEACKWEGNSCGTGNFCSWPNSTCAPAGKLGESCADRACAEDLICGDNEKCGETPLASDSLCKGTPPTF